MDINLMLQAPTGWLIVIIAILVLVSVGLGLMALVFERQSNLHNQQRFTDLTNQLTELQDEFSKLEKLQFIAAQRQQRTDQVLQDMYKMLEEQSRLLYQVKDRPAQVVNTNTSDIPNQSNYEHAIRMAKEGMSGAQIQEICGLSEGEVNLLLDLHQN